MSISVKNVSKLYGKQYALRDVNFEIGHGEIVGFLGPNGAGKSTMMKIITGYIPQTTGYVSVCDFDVSDDSIKVRQNVGYLPEHNPLYLDMYIKEYLEFVGGVYKVQGLKQKITTVIETVGLTLEQNKKIGSLSKGYRQRVGLAQALIHDPKVLILDEPTTGLDPNQIVEIRNLISSIGKEKTIMMSTHIMQEVEAICDRVVIIDKGKIVADKPTKELQNSVSDNDVMIVEFSQIIAHEAIKQIKDVLQVEKINDLTFRVIAEKQNDCRNQLFQLAIKESSSIVSLQKEEQKMEHIFKQLTGKGK